MEAVAREARSPTKAERPWRILQLEQETEQNPLPAEPLQTARPGGREGGENCQTCPGMIDADFALFPPSPRSFYSLWLPAQLDDIIVNG